MHSIPFSAPSGIQVLSSLPTSLNRMVRSRLTDFEASAITQGVSLKYVTTGTEHYEIEGRVHEVGAGQFLLVNHRQQVKVQVRSKKPVQGLCIYLDPKILQEILPGRSPEFLENVYSAQKTRLAHSLDALAQRKQAGQPLDEAVYFQLSELLWAEQVEHLPRIDTLPSRRKTTREELYRRLLLARDYLHDHYQESVSLHDLARVACLSEYYFLRSFRRAFGQTPNQYQIHLRMQKAREMILSQKHSISEIAHLIGFSDIAYFSRMFKRHNGQAPSRFQPGNI
jgi:AraC family transcriptional regulator